MALAIDTAAVTQPVPWVQDRLDQLSGLTKRNLQIYRVCVHGTVFHNDASNISAIRHPGQEAMDWQADEDDDLDEVEVFHHLKQLAQSRTAGWTETERSNATTTLVTSSPVDSRLLIASALPRPLSSFRRYSFRYSVLDCDYENPLVPRDEYRWCTVKDIPNFLQINIWTLLDTKLRIVGANMPRVVAWEVQYDIVDLHSRRSHPTGRSHKRRRSTLNPFHRVSSSPPVPDTPHLPDVKQFKGVRYRRDRRTWTAEMKPPKYNHKVYFGEFKSETQAARVVDVAYYHYGKLNFLNFPDTPGLLSARPAPAGLSEGDKLRFVKEQAKWVSSIASTLPSSSACVTSTAIPDPSFSGCQVDNSKFLTISEIASFMSCGDADEADDGISQPRHSLQLDSIASHGLMEPNPVIADAGGFVTGTLQPWISEDVVVDPGLLDTWWSPSSSVQITDGWDGAQHSGVSEALTDIVTPMTENML